MNRYPYQSSNKYRKITTQNYIQQSNNISFANSNNRFNPQAGLKEILSQGLDQKLKNLGTAYWMNKARNKINRNRVNLILRKKKSKYKIGNHFVAKTQCLIQQHTKNKSYDHLSAVLRGFNIKTPKHKISKEDAGFQSFAKIATIQPSQRNIQKQKSNRQKLIKNYQSSKNQQIKNKQKQSYLQQFNYNQKLLQLPTEKSVKRVSKQIETDRTISPWKTTNYKLK